MNEVLARTEQVVRRFGDAVAVDGVSLEVRADEIVGLLGPNGAGKTSLIAMLTGLRRPTSGRVELFGGDPTVATNRRELGVTPQESAAPPTLRVREVTDWVARHYADPLPTTEILARFGLADIANRQAGGLSGGQRRRLAVALAFVGRPRLVVLDEPTTGLDVESRHALWHTIRDCHVQGTTVLMSSHYLEEVERLAQRVVVLGHGKVLADDSVAGIRRLVGLKRVAVTMSQPPELDTVARSERDGDRWSMWTGDADALVRDLVGSGVPFSDLEVQPASLEDAFLALTGGSVAPSTQHDDNDDRTAVPA